MYVDPGTDGTAPLPTSSDSSVNITDITAIIGGVVAVVLIIAIAATTVVISIVALVLRNRRAELKMKLLK